MNGDTYENPHDEDALLTTNSSKEEKLNFQPTVYELEQLVKQKMLSDTEFRAVTLSPSKVLSEDSDNLGPISTWPVCIGFIDLIAGDGGRLVPDYQITREQALALVRFWYKEILDCRYFWFEYRQTGSREIRLRPYAALRINRIEAEIGFEAVDEAIKEATDEFSQGLDPELWQMFLRGEEPRRDRYGIAMRPSDAEQVSAPDYSELMETDDDGPVN